jgi:ABC-type transporter Mla maintaining outer membrane lipid asymmetry ATPase subunit MlaF
VDPIIRVSGLRTQFGRQVVHDNLDLEVVPGEVIGVVGGSGTGKSVLLRTIIGLNRLGRPRRRSSGRIRPTSARQHGGGCRRAGACCFRAARSSAP